MPDSHDLYRRHDELESRASDLRTDFDRLCDEFDVGWDTDEDRIQRRLDLVDERLPKVHDAISEVERDEIDRANGAMTLDGEARKKLIADVEASLEELDRFVDETEEILERWRPDLPRDGGDPE